MAPTILPIVGATKISTLESISRGASLRLESGDLEILDRERPWSEPIRRKLWKHGSSKQAEVVLVMGPPASGKTSHIGRFLENGYQRLNRDERGGRLAELLPPLVDLLRQGHRRIVLDNTYPTRASRRLVVEAASQASVPTRCIWIDTPRSEALYNACLRMLERHERILGPDEIRLAARDDPNMLPPAAIHRWFQRFEPPSLEEGFAAVDRIAFERRIPIDATQRALLLDVDGTLRRSTGPAPFPLHPDQVEILPGRREALDRLVAEGYLLLAVSNQSGIGRGQISESVALACFERTWDLLGHRPAELCFSPHVARASGVWDRKPMPGFGVALVEKYRLDRSACLVIGDLESDREFANNLGIPFREADAFFG